MRHICHRLRTPSVSSVFARVSAAFRLHFIADVAVIVAVVVTGVYVVVTGVYVVSRRRRRPSPVVYMGIRLPSIGLIVTSRRFYHQRFDFRSLPPFPFSFSSLFLFLSKIQLERDGRESERANMNDARQRKEKKGEIIQSASRPPKTF